jgi:hypothetical protein
MLISYYYFSEFITDTLDNNANIEAVEVISQILRLYAAELSDQVSVCKMILIFMSYTVFRDLQFKPTRVMLVFKLSPAKKNNKK